MNLEQIVKETVAKIVAEKKGKDLTGDGKIDSADYLKARSNAIEKAKGLDEDNINDFDDVAGYIIDLIVDEGIITPEEAESDEVINNALEISEKMFGGYGASGQGISTSDYNRAARALVASLGKSLNEDHKDHEVSMAQSSLNSILRSAMELKAKIGNQEINIPAWIQDHITNSENFIDQASQGYHEYSNGGEHGKMDEAKESNDDKIEKYKKYTYTLDGKIVKPEITFLNNILKAMLDNKIYNIGAPENGKVELTPESGKKGTYTEEMDEANLGHNELSSIEPEGRFWIVKYGTEEKVFDSENKARAFYDELNKPKGLDEWTISRWQHYAGIK